jgi:mannosyltransferase
MSKELSLQNKNSRNGFEVRKYLSSTVLLGIILIIGLALRLYDLGSESYWIDEMSTVIEGQQSITTMLASGRLDQPPAFYIPFHLWEQMLGTNEVSTRSFSVLTGIGSIILIYIIGRELFGKEVGLLSAFFMAITEFQIYYSQIARFYSFFEFMALLSFLFFILSLKSKKKIFFGFYVLASVIMVYGHTYGVFILVAQNLFFFLQIIKNRNIVTIWLISQALIGLALAPYAFPLLFGTGGIRGAVDFNIGGLSAPSFLDIFRSLYHFVMSPRYERNWAFISINYLAAATLLVVGIWVYAVQQRKKFFSIAANGWFAGLQEVPDVASKILLLISWLLCPIVLPFIASLVIGPMYQEHYTISAAPALYLLLSVGLFSMRKMVPIILSLGVLALMIGPGLGYYYATDIQEQWREVATYVNENSGSGDAIVFAPNMGIGIQQRVFNFYYQGSIQGCGLDSQLIETTAISEALKQCISGHKRFWVIIPDYSNVISDNRYKSFFLDPNQTSIHLIKESQFVNISVYLFGLTK